MPHMNSGGCFLGTFSFALSLSPLTDLAGYVLVGHHLTRYRLSDLSLPLF